MFFGAMITAANDARSGVVAYTRITSDPSPTFRIFASIPQTASLFASPATERNTVVIDALEDFTFEEDKHQYSDHNGIVRVGVTEGLKRCQIFDYSMVDPDLLEFKRNLGQNVHGWTAEVDRHGLANVDPTSLTPLERGFGDGWLNFCASARPKFLEIEKPMMRTVGGVVIAGTMDRIALIGRRAWVLDIKCSSMMHPGWGLQLADYEMLYTGKPFVGIMGRMIVRLLGDGRFRTASFMDPVDGVVALAAGRWVANPADEASYVTVSNWRRNMRIYRDDS